MKKSTDTSHLYISRAIEDENKILPHTELCQKKIIDDIFEFQQA